MNPTRNCLFALVPLMLLLGALPPCLGAQPSLEGAWEGHIEVQGQRLIIQTRFSEAGDTAWTGEIDIPQQGATGLPLVDIAAAGDSVSFRFNAGTGMVRFEGNFSGDSLITGTFHQSGMGFPFRLEKGPGSRQEKAEEPETEPKPYRSEELSVANGEVTLAGTLTLPEEGASPAPCVVLISGSGAQNRDEEIFGFGVFRTIADHLGRNGIAVYRYDDRGVGGSSGTHGEAGRETLVSDVRAIVSRLKEHKGVDGGRIGLLGHSQGGIIAGSIAASPEPGVDFVVLMASPTRPLSEVVVEQVRTMLEEQDLPQSLIEQQTAMQAAVFDTLRGSGDFTEVKAWMKKQIVDQINELPESSRASIPDPEVYAASQVSRQIDLITSPSYASFLDYDPASDLRRAGVPVLALYGGKDQQIKWEGNLGTARRALHQAGVAHRVAFFPGANHLFQEAETGSVSEYASLEKAFVEGFLSTLTEWIRKQTGR